MLSIVLDIFLQPHGKRIKALQSMFMRQLEYAQQTLAA